MTNISVIILTILSLVFHFIEIYRLEGVEPTADLSKSSVKQGVSRSKFYLRAKIGHHLGQLQTTTYYMRGSLIYVRRIIESVKSNHAR